MTLTASRYALGRLSRSSGRAVETAESELREALLETNKKTRERELPGLLFSVPAD
jgi:hypothetical protein